MIERIPEILEILFLNLPPELIWKRIYNATLIKDSRWFDDVSPKAQEDTFLIFSTGKLPNLNGDARHLLFQNMKQQMSEAARKYDTDSMPFILLSQIGADLLTTRGDEPFCRCDKALEWRKLYHYLGQDTITCAFLAEQDRQRHAERRDFSWPAVLRTDQERLNFLLRKGLAENHYHVNGSTQSLAITWCYAMNHPLRAKHLLQSDRFSYSLHDHQTDSGSDRILSRSDRLILAALLRSVLFQRFHSRYKKYSCLEQLRKYFMHLDPLIPLENDITVLSNVHGFYPKIHGSRFCLDYALHRELDAVNFDAPYRLLAGERALLYECFSAYFNGLLPTYESYLLYVYLMLKAQFRLEMIQSNHVYGFDNFHRYNQRKNFLWEDTPYKWEAIRMSIYAPTHLEAVQSLEARFCPASSIQENIRNVLFFDQAEFEARHQTWRYHNSPFALFEQHPDVFLNLPYFYVLHFPKHADVKPEPDTLLLRCRHSDYRAQLKIWTEAIAATLQISPYFCNRIRGIDACSNEITCRPEVFGTSFRYLRQITGSSSGWNSIILPLPEWFLSATYHAGEDFYDIADGLRAIDEAISFLELRRGDRLGHALAMGIDPQAHYEGINYRVPLPKQVCLDNFVWLIYRSRELGIAIDPASLERLRQAAILYFREIYCKGRDDNPYLLQALASSLQEYYFSIKLRGDLPELYKTSAYVGISPLNQCYETYAECGGDPDLSSYRSSPCVTYLCYLYQYCEDVKQRGTEMVTIPVDHAYCTLIMNMQHAIQKRILEKDITIETNPTSNVSIGSFHQYKDHPIFRWNRHGLEYGAENELCPQLPVCVNSDDLGVFDTSLEFEFALLYDALSKMTNENGNRLYQKHQILDYLENLRQSGFQAIFPPHTRIYNRNFSWEQAESANPEHENLSRPDFPW